MKSRGLVLLTPRVGITCAGVEGRSKRVRGRRVASELEHRSLELPMERALNTRLPYRSLEGPSAWRHVSLYFMI